MKEVIIVMWKWLMNVKVTWTYLLQQLDVMQWCCSRLCLRDWFIAIIIVKSLALLKSVVGTFDFVYDLHAI